MVVTLHFIDESFEMISIIIGFIRVLYPHTSERLASALFQCVNDMLPDLLQSIWTITADNATTNPAMTRLYNQQLQLYLQQLADSRISDSADDDVSEMSNPPNCDVPSEDKVVLIRCFAHSIQIAVKEGLRQTPMVDVAIGRIRDLVKKVSDSPKMKERFAEICNSVNCMGSLQLDVETRWNSTYDMLKMAIQLRKPMDEFLKRIRERYEGFSDLSIAPMDPIARPIDQVSWGAIKDFCNFLEPFKDATDLMSGSSYPTLGLAVPIFYQLQKQVNDTILSSNGFRSSHSKKFALAVQSKLRDYEDLLVNRHAVISAVLDPRVKSMLVNCGIDINDAKQLVISSYHLNYEDR